jgi:hypothetical protein
VQAEAAIRIISRACIEATIRDPEEAVKGGYPELMAIRLPTRARKHIPHEFVLEAMTGLSPRTNPMFGCLAVYVGEKIVLILRERNTADDGVWLATTPEHHESLRREFPNMRSIQVFGKDVTGWQVLPVDAPDFEESAFRACDLIAARDPRIGKVPGARNTNRKRKSAAASVGTPRGPH